MESFIEGVRAQPCLWNPLHPEYRETHVKDEAWQCVVDYCDNSAIPNIQVAKTEWKKLRDNHRDALKRAKLGKNKLLPAQITTWKYAKAMQFLEPHMKYRITEHIEMEPPTVTSKTSDHDVSTTESTDGPTIVKRRRYIDQSTITPTYESPSKCRQDSDALESFFNCILQSTREMPQWMQTQVKKKIFAVIIEAEEQLSSPEPPVAEQRYDTSNMSFETKIKTEVFTEDSCDNDNTY